MSSGEGHVTGRSLAFVANLSRHAILFSLGKGVIKVLLDDGSLSAVGLIEVDVRINGQLVGVEVWILLGVEAGAGHLQVGGVVEHPQASFLSTVVELSPVLVDGRNHERQRVVVHDEIVLQNCRGGLAVLEVLVKHGDCLDQYLAATSGEIVLDFVVVRDGESDATQNVGCIIAVVAHDLHKSAVVLHR